MSLIGIHSSHPHRVVQFLSRCQHPDGGFAGGPGQLPHLAPTYAAILSLAVLGTQDAYDCIDRWVWLCSLLWQGLVELTQLIVGGARKLWLSLVTQAVLLRPLYVTWSDKKGLIAQLTMLRYDGLKFL